MNDTNLSVQSEELFPTDTGKAAVNTSLFIFGAIFILVFMVITIVSLWRVYKKAGEPGWKALIPVYNNWVFLRLGGQSGWWAILGLVPVFNLVSYIFTCIAAHKIGLKLQKEGSFVILYIFLPLIWYIWLAFDKSTWQSDAASTTALVPETVAPAPVVPPVATYQPNQDQNNTPPSAPIIQ